MIHMENVGLNQKGVIESTIFFHANGDGTYTIGAKQAFSRKNDNIVEMQFTKNGMNAIIGQLRAMVELGD